MNASAIPICVDLDGTLTPVDTLHENLLDLCRHSPRSLLSLPLWISKGKAHFKHMTAASMQADVALIPIRDDLLVWLKSERAKGRRLVLATACNRRMAENIASKLEIFDDIVASSHTENLSGESKRRALVARYGERGFDYVGNGPADMAVWRSARQAIVVGGSRIAARAARTADVAQVFPVARPPVRAWFRAMRLHQWVKNALVFIPALSAHRIAVPAVFIASLLAFVSFSLCASSVYVVNDLLDLSSDRRHPRKRTRPFAAGTLSARSGLMFAALLLLGSYAIALAIGRWFCLVLSAYYVITWAYSLRLKRAALVDVMTLAGLYTLRIIAGSTATMIEPSFWLLAFSIFVFLCLGNIKRYAELYDAKQEGKIGGHGRGYSGHDLELLMNMGVASGFCAIVVMALYINSPDSMALYRHVQLMWLICPLLLYWISRMWLLASRGQMDDDPVVFAIKDRISLTTLGLIGLLVFLAS
jgi:4-hydroxybenzoate polyprenyltransferase